MTLYLRILSYIKPYMHRLIFAMFCTIMAAAGNLYIPWIIKDMIDEYFDPEYVACVLGDSEVSSKLLDSKFDYIFLPIHLLVSVVLY